MAEMLIDNLKELRTLIDQQHLLYLELDESPKKIDQRSKLESFIKEYLCLAPHDAKFTFHQTADVLHRSASTKNNFSAYKAVVAWKAIGKYADNLISHPWRKEYRDIKLYCGFYKYEIEENLVGAELMFEAMGYRHAGNSTMTLPGILDPDRITSVSKDAIMAFVECQIIKQIWEALTSHFNITWLEILEFRENHTGNPEQVIRALTYKYHQKQYQEQMYHRPGGSNMDHTHFIQPDCHYGHHSMGYYNHSLYPGPSYSVPIQNRYGPPISPQQMPPVYAAPIPPTYASSHHAIKPHHLYPVNGYHMHPPCTSTMSLQHVPHNGYSLVPMMYSVSSIVPTGQLIELDSFPNHNCGESYPQHPSNIMKYNSALENTLYHQDCLKHDGPSLSRKAKEDGAGSWENWDYVYRNLESHGYKKEPVNEVPFRENLLSSSQTNSSDVDSIIQTDMSDKFKKLSVDENTKIKSETSSSRSFEDEEVKLKSRIEKSKTESENFKEITKSESQSFKISPKRESSKKNFDITSSTSTVSKGNISITSESELPSGSKSLVRPRKSREETKPLVVNLDKPEEKWQCVTCTYLNSLANNVCEMCYKSRERGSELTPQPSGGAECPKCTLVNEPGLSNCAACNSSLKDSPTYI